MSTRNISTYWRHGFRALTAVLVTLCLINLLYFAVDELLPDNAWLKFSVASLLLFLVGPFLASGAFRLVYRSRESRQAFPTVTVATYSDEPSAHIAASVLDRSGITAVVSSGSIGSHSGLAMPAGGIRLLVSILDRTKAEIALAAAREQAVRQ